MEDVNKAIKLFKVSLMTTKLHPSPVQNSPLRKNLILQILTLKKLYPF